MTIDVILPVLDEAEALPAVLGAFPPGLRPLVVDNGSRDGSGEIAARLGARVVTEPQRGFGAACFAGLIAAESELVAFMDADGSLDPNELPALADAVGDGSCDLCLGTRRPVSRAAWPAHARIANRVLAAELHRRTHIRVTDIGPMRVARREALIELQIADRRFGWPLEMVLRAAAAQWRIAERPVSYRPRAGGRSKVSGSALGTIRAVRDMGALLR
jgi:glycosyltransferase involved in cell wall biosynthesis